ncbi:MAG: cupin domain-containing protein [Ilumatobacteraceae bacterium]|nr:cupin domain-containing protein [Ilumatobacteraceae bacterium]
MSDDSDLGGEPACWAHFVDELDVADGSDGRPLDGVELADLDESGSSGAVWSLPHGGDLDANAVWLRPGDAIDEHVNREVDVLVVVWRGAGELAVDGRARSLRPGVVVQVPRGSRRRIRAASEGLTYLSVHRRRDGLSITRR